MTAPEAFFLAAGAGRDGQRFCLLHTPARATPQRAVLYVHPFAEEMNKTRRMAALQARAFAEAGHAVLQIDLHGCGDSSGDFADASWQGWLADVADAGRWLRRRFPAAPLCLWGLRAGCLLAAEAAGRLDEPCDFLFWQPAGAGKPLLQQFLRLKLAGELLEGKSKGVMDGLKQQLAAGTAVDVAGYRLSPDVAAGLERASLKPPTGPGRARWIEISNRAEAALSPASERPIAQWREAGFEVDARVVEGPAFWQTTEIEEAPALIGASLAALGANGVAVPA
jgi:exosortase A-associated hydrolase 2